MQFVKSGLLMRVAWDKRSKTSLLPQTRLKVDKSRRQSWLTLAAIFFLLWILLAASRKKGQSNQTLQGSLLEGRRATSAETERRIPEGLYTLVRKLQASTLDLSANSARDITGIDVPLAPFAGKVSLVVNVASACGYTDSNYRGLVQLYNTFKEAEFEILAFPCNQFGGQETGTNQEIQDFCRHKYNVTFPLFSKIDVNGPNVDPVYAYLKRHLPTSEGGGGGIANGADLVWNFQKILVNQDGVPIRLFTQEMDESSLEHAIKMQLTHT